MGQTQTRFALSLLAVLLPLVEALPVRYGVQSVEGSARVRAAAGAAVQAGVLDGDVNIVHLTDVHSWLSGHLHEPDDEADYPDVLAFFQHLEAIAHAKVTTVCGFSRCHGLHEAGGS